MGKRASPLSRFSPTHATAPLRQMTIFQFGISHSQAPVALRELVAFAPAQVSEALATLADSPAILEVALLSTCNRTELYVASEDPDRAREAIVQYLVDRRGLEEGMLARFFGAHQDLEAAHHLMRVAAGLDSQILGEGQILAQVREAVAVARSSGTCGPVLDSLFRHAIAAGKRVRTETTISQGAVSVGAAAVELARRELGGLSGRTVVVLGTGKIGEVTLKHLSGQGVSRLLLANRTLDSAQALAGTCGGEAVPFHALTAVLCEADVVLCCTGAPHFVLGEADLAPVARVRAEAGRPLIMVDVSVPRNIDPAARGLQGVSLFDIDDLSSLADRTRADREAQAKIAESLVEEEIDGFASWMQSYQAAPTIASLRHKLDGLRQSELDRFLARHGDDLSPDQQAAVEQLTRAITNKFLHEPTVGLKSQTGAKRDAHASAIRELFHLQVPRRAAGSKRRP